MNRYAVALTIALLGSGVSPAWAGHGCWGGGFVSSGCYGGYGGGWTAAGYGCGGGSYGSGWVGMGSGCWGGCSGWKPMGYGCCGSGCLGGAPVGYGCGGYSTGWVSVGYGCSGGAAVADAASGSSYAAATAYKSYYEAKAPSRNAAPVKQLAGRGAVKPPVVRRPVPKKAPTAAKDAVAGEKIGLPEDVGKAPATIVVRLPAAAKLKVNNAVTRQSSEKRTLVSPPLDPGKDFHYTLKAELVRNGRTFTAARRVAVRAGEVKQVTLEFAAPAEPPPSAGAERILPEEETPSRGDSPQPAAARPSRPTG